MNGSVKHLIECHCVLPQYRDRQDSVWHKFVVFSVIDDKNIVIPKYVQCNNCGVIHRVFDIMRSEIAPGNDNDSTVMTIEDVSPLLPASVASILSSYKADLPTWEETLFIVENKLWDRRVVLSSDNTPEELKGKCLRFSETGAVRIEPFSMKLTLY